MKKSILIAGLTGLLLTACSNSAQNHPYVETFVTETGTKFELRADSTTLILFSDTLKYEGTWMPCKSADNLDYANIEFAGYPRYYYLKDGKLYRSEREMRHDAHGEKVKYQD